MQKFFKYKWAVDGETIAVPNAVDPAGFVSYRQGYGADYSRVYGTDPLAKAPERVKLNAVLQDITGEVQSLQVHGFPDYITADLNEGTPYAYDIGAVVRWTDNKNYRNTVESNTDDPDTNGWVLYNDPSEAISEATSKTTPSDADQFGVVDSASSNVLKKLTWANIKTALTSAFAPKANPIFSGTVSLDTNATLVFEGSSADAYETTLTVVNPTADRTLSLPNESGTLATQGYVDGKMVLATSVTATGTAVDFTGIPSWAKRITVMLSDISLSGTSPVIVQLGDIGGVENTGYTGHVANTSAASSLSTGFQITAGSIANTTLFSSTIDINKISDTKINAKCLTGLNLSASSNHVGWMSGSKTLSDTLDRIRITTVNGTDTFDAGTINIMYEG